MGHDLGRNEIGIEKVVKAGDGIFKISKKESEFHTKPKTQRKAHHKLKERPEQWLR